MSTSPEVEAATKIADLRLRINENIRKGLPHHTGITAEELQFAIDKSRATYQAAATKSKASGVSSPSTAGPMDLKALFTDKSSEKK